MPVLEDLPGQLVQVQVRAVPEVNHLRLSTEQTEQLLAHGGWLDPRYIYLQATGAFTSINSCMYYQYRVAMVVRIEYVYVVMPLARVLATNWGTLALIF